MESLRQSDLALLHELVLGVNVRLDDEEDRESMEKLKGHGYVGKDGKLTATGKAMGDRLIKKIDELSNGLPYSEDMAPKPATTFKNMQGWGDDWFYGMYMGKQYVTNNMMLLAGRPKSAKILGAKEGTGDQRHAASMLIKSVLEPNRYIHPIHPVEVRLYSYRYDRVIIFRQDDGKRLVVKEKYYNFLKARFKRARTYVFETGSGMRLLIGKIVGQGFQDVVGVIAPVRDMEG